MTNQDLINKARKEGKAYYSDHDQVYTLDGTEAVQLANVRIALEVPHEERAYSYLLECKWDAQAQSRYIQLKHINLNLTHNMKGDSFFDFIGKWTRPCDRIYLQCPAEHIQYALRRGASSDVDGQLFVPTWHAAVKDMNYVIESVCRWLPTTHPLYRQFNSVAESARHFMTCGQPSLSEYLSEEFEYLMQEVAKGTTATSGIYVVRGFNGAWFKDKAWDAE
ncbi:MAG TPA: hypothetical protein VGD04_04415 [Methylophilus sp.]